VLTNRNAFLHADTGTTALAERRSDAGELTQFLMNAICVGDEVVSETSQNTTWMIVDNPCCRVARQPHLLGIAKEPYNSSVIALLRKV
jgi:hypothetical protein